MVYRELKFLFPADRAHELVSELFDYGCLGTQTEEREGGVEVKAYFKEEPSLPPGLAGFLVGQSKLPDRDWNREWKKHFKPVKVSRRLWVAPSWYLGKFKEPPGSLVIYIYPGRAFGTGTHETTKLTMRLIEESLKEGSSFLDVGSGSGILSILARKLGAFPVVGCDVQKGIEEEVKRNCSLNRVDFEFVEGSLDKVKGEFDVVVSNIEKHHLEPLLPGIVDRAKDKLILSGILLSQRDDFVRKVESLGLNLVKELREGEWAAFLFTK
jgi:ribosomal protein L11 methyltransferase